MLSRMEQTLEQVKKLSLKRFATGSCKEMRSFMLQIFEEFSKEEIQKQNPKIDRLRT